jgi:hypothetical protein
MRGFLTKVCIALLLALAFHAAFGTLADGHTDAYYLRFTQGRKHALVLGTSRSAQGIHPDVFNAPAAAAQFEGPMYNFSFTVGHSPYGPAYLHAVEKKLDPSTRNGLFLVTVDPWSLCMNASSLNDTTQFGKGERTLADQWTFTGEPNYEYLIRHWDLGWGALARWPLDHADTSAFLMADGRLELHIHMDAASIARRTTNKIAEYRSSYLHVFAPSSFRLRYLERMVAFLQPHGSVVLLRLPVGTAIRQMESEVDPFFDEHMQDVAARAGIRYLNLSSALGDTAFVDGNHMSRAAGAALSGMIRGQVLRAE